MTSTPAFQRGVFQPKRTCACIADLVEGREASVPLASDDAEYNSLVACSIASSSHARSAERYYRRKRFDRVIGRLLMIDVIGLVGRDIVRYVPSSRSLPGPRGGVSLLKPERDDAAPSGRAPCLSHSTHRRLITRESPPQLVGQHRLPSTAASSCCPPVLLRRLCARDAAMMRRIPKRPPPQSNNNTSKD